MSRKPTVSSAAIAAVSAAAMLVVEHYALVGLKVPFVYVAGVLALQVPFSGWCAYYQLWWVVGTAWAITLAGGAAVIGCYTVDWALAASPDWLLGAGVLVVSALALVAGLAGMVWRLARQNRALQAQLALRRGMSDGVEQR